LRLSELLFLSYSPAFFITHVPRLPFNFIQAANRVKCLFGQLAFIRDVQIKKLAAGMSHAADFGQYEKLLCPVQHPAYRSWASR